MVEGGQEAEADIAFSPILMGSKCPLSYHAAFLQGGIYEIYPMSRRGVCLGHGLKFRHSSMSLTNETGSFDSDEEANQKKIISPIKIRTICGSYRESPKIISRHDELNLLSVVLCREVSCLRHPTLDGIL